MVRHGLLFSFRRPEIRRNLIGFRAGLKGLRFRACLLVAPDAAGIVFDAVLHAVIMIQDRLNEHVQTLAVAETVEHGKPGFVSVPGQIQQMPVGFRSAHPADLRRMGHGHGQRVFRVINGAVILLEGIAQIRHPREGSVHGALQQIAVDFLPVADLYGVNMYVRRQINIRAGGKGQFLFSKVRTFCAHFKFLPVHSCLLFFIRYSWILISCSYRKSMQ